LIAEQLTMTDLWTQTNWYAIQTKPYREDQAASNIGRLGVTVFLPKMKKEKRTFSRRLVTFKPLFPGYIFARFCPSPHLHSIQYARGVNRIVCADGLPIPVDEEIISMIHSRIGEDGFVNLGLCELKKGQDVQITDGPLQGLVGIFEPDLSDRDRATILFTTVEYQLRALVEKSRLSAVTVH
jgi:transcriptional antiterminator RfaH